MMTPAHDGAAIVTSGLTKRYGRIEALVDLDLTVPRGLIYGFLGPNGAGKTTTIRLLMGFIRPSAGSARVLGHDVWTDGVAARRQLGFLVPAEALYPEMTGQTLLDYLADLTGRPPTRRQMLLDALDLGSDALGRRLGSYSKGMKQKLALTAAIQHDPELLILDEPTDGLDPLIQHAFQAVLQELRDRGRTIFMSSHDLTEIERVCERVALVRDGRLIAEETIDGLKARHRRTAHITFGDGMPDGLATLPGVTILGRHGPRVELAIDGDIQPLIRFLALCQVRDLLLLPPRLEEVFMAFYDQSGRATLSPNGHAATTIDPLPVTRSEPAEVSRR